MQLPSEILYHVQTKHHITCLISYLIGLCDELMYHMMQETRVQSLGWEDPLEKEMATHSSILAWRIPWTEEPGGLQSMGSQSRTRLSDFTSLMYHKTLCKVLYSTTSFEIWSYYNSQNRTFALFQIECQLFIYQSEHITSGDDMSFPLFMESH